MHLTPRYINIILNILLGVAWAFSVIGFFYGFGSISANIFFKFLNALVHTAIGLFFFFFIEALFVIFNKCND